MGRPSCKSSTELGLGWTNWQHRIQLLQEVIFTENTAPDREIWDEKGGLIKKGAAEIAERDQDRGFGGF